MALSAWKGMARSMVVPRNWEHSSWGRIRWPSMQPAVGSWVCGPKALAIWSWDNRDDLDSFTKERLISSASRSQTWLSRLTSYRISVLCRSRYPLDDQGGEAAYFPRILSAFPGSPACLDSEIDQE